MKKIVTLFGLVALFAFAAPAAYACQCTRIENVRIGDDGKTPKPTPEEIEKWRREQTDHALFTGKVMKVKKVKFKHAGETFRMKEVTVRVERYWLGVSFLQPEIVIHTGLGGGDCGVPYVKGSSYFFWPSRVKGLLETHICGQNEISEQIIKDMDQVFGSAKEFPNAAR